MMRIEAIEEKIKLAQRNIDILTRELDYLTSLSLEQQLAIELHRNFVRCVDRWSYEGTTHHDGYFVHQWTGKVHIEWVDRANQILVVFLSIRDHKSTFSEGVFKIVQILGKT